VGEVEPGSITVLTGSVWRADVREAAGLLWTPSSRPGAGPAGGVCHERCDDAGRSITISPKGGIVLMRIAWRVGELVRGSIGTLASRRGST